MWLCQQTKERWNLKYQMIHMTVQARLDVSSIPLTVIISKVIDLNKTSCYGQNCYACSLISVQERVLNSFEW